MKLLGYGEDALTLWALTSRLVELLEALDDRSNPHQCQVLYRPSFGRSGGKGRAEFGEFDFIVLTERKILLGESKWDKSSEEIDDGALNLRPEQKTRHDIMRFYIDRFAFGPYKEWNEFIAAEASSFSKMSHGKSLARATKLLGKNLEQVLLGMREHFHSQPEITDVLLYLHRNRAGTNLPSKGPDRFKLVPLDYSVDMNGNMISIEM